MVDTITPAERSRRMALISSKDTKPELLIRKALHARGLRYRLHAKHLAGTPDIVFSKKRLVLFVNGCFWHGHRCRIGHIPKTNSLFWKDKIRKNRLKDAKNLSTLRREGWSVYLIWECQISNKQRLDDVVEEIIMKYGLGMTA